MTSNAASNGIDLSNADAARARIAATVDEIQDKLDPRRIVGDALDRVQGNSLDLIDRAGKTLRAHPLALGAAAAAVGIALLARNRLANARVDLGDEATDYTDYDDGYADPEYLIAEPGIAPAKAAAMPAAKAPAKAPVLAETAANSPILSILLGLAAGAALGVLLPAGEAERRALGNAGDKLGAAARAAMRRAADELGDAGLNVDSVRSRASEASRKARSAARSVVDAARDELAS